MGSTSISSSLCRVSSSLKRRSVEHPRGRCPSVLFLTPILKTAPAIFVAIRFPLKSIDRPLLRASSLERFSFPSGANDSCLLKFPAFFLCFPGDFPFTAFFEGLLIGSSCCIPMSIGWYYYKSNGSYKKFCQSSIVLYALKTRSIDEPWTVTRSE